MAHIDIVHDFLIVHPFMEILALYIFVSLRFLTLGVWFEHQTIMLYSEMIGIALISSINK